MFKIFSAVLAALVLVSCGGGGGVDSTVSATPSTVLLKGNKVSPIPDLVAGPVSVVNTPTTKGSLRDIGVTNDGGYVVAWFSGSSTIYIQAYDSSGAKAGAQTPLQLEILASTADDSRRAIEGASVAVLNDGTVAVVYLVTRQILVGGSVENDSGIYFQLFDANGKQLMGETLITGLQESPLNPRAPFISGYSVRALSDGGFVVASTINRFVTGSPSISGLTLQWFNSQGQPQVSAGVGSFPDLTLTSIEADTHGGVTLAGSYFVPSSRIDNAVWHYDANHVLQQIIAPESTPIRLLPIDYGYVLFTRGIDGTTAQILDSQANPVGTPNPLPFIPAAARELADGSYVAIGLVAGTFVAQRFASDGTPVGEAMTIDSSGTLPRVAALADTGFAAAWTGPGTTGATDVFTQRFTERFSDGKKACLNSAKGLKGQQRKAFIDDCLA